MNEAELREKNKEEVLELQRMKVHTIKALKIPEKDNASGVTRIKIINVLRVPNGVIYDFGGGSTQFVPFKVTTLII